MNNKINGNPAIDKLTQRMPCTLSKATKTNGKTPAH
jgi:hypothetical protein